jgi:sporulation protein YlmC with PRC-barrel domain
LLEESGEQEDITVELTREEAMKPTMPATQSPSTTQKRNPRVLSATTAIGDKIKNAAGEDLGELKELMIDVNSGQIAYAVLSFGGFLGLGEKLFAIPWQALTLDAKHHAFILNVDKEKLENAPGFDNDNWPETTEADDTWLAGVYDYYGYGPYWR